MIDLQVLMKILSYIHARNVLSTFGSRQSGQEIRSWTNKCIVYSCNSHPPKLNCLERTFHFEDGIWTMIASNSLGKRNTERVVLRKLSRSSTVDGKPEIQKYPSGIQITWYKRQLGLKNVKLTLLSALKNKDKNCRCNWILQTFDYMPDIAD